MARPSKDALEQKRKLRRFSKNLIRFALANLRDPH
jgi:hypothetical protein